MIKIPIILVLIITSKTLYASCFIDEIVDLVDDEYTSSEIREECNSKVDESRCSVSKIVRYAKKSKDIDYILRKCEKEESCTGLIAPDTLIRDNNYQRLRCHNESETNIQTIF